MKQNTLANKLCLTNEKIDGAYRHKASFTINAYETFLLICAQLDVDVGACRGIDFDNCVGLFDAFNEMSAHKNTHFYVYFN